MGGECERGGAVSVSNGECECEGVSGCLSVGMKGGRLGGEIGVWGVRVSVEGCE